MCRRVYVYVFACEGGFVRMWQGIILWVGEGCLCPCRKGLYSGRDVCLTCHKGVAMYVSMLEEAYVFDRGVCACLEGVCTFV